jgi:DNA polymerase-1
MYNGYMKKLAIIDGKSVFYRGYYAMPGLSTRDGTPTGGVYGFANLAFEIVRRLRPDYVVVAWDKAKTNIRRRKEIYDGYKAGRKPAPADFYAQIPVLQDLLGALHWPFFECDDYEADDIMGTLARQAEKLGLETYLISSDLDMLQIIDEHTKMYALKKGVSSIEEFDRAVFEQKYGIKVEQFLDLKALKGDSSDNIPGVPGVGEKTAVSLLRQYGDLDGVFAHAGEQRASLALKLENGKDSALMSKQLAEIWFDAPVKLDLDSAKLTNVDRAALTDELKKLEFNSLLRRLPEVFRLGNTPATSTGLQTSLLQDDTENFTLDEGTLVARDVKKLLHAKNWSVDSLPTRVFDINQARFLLDPLGRQVWSMGSVKEAYQEVEAELAKQPKLETVAEQFDFPLIPVLYKMEKRGIKIDQPFFAKMSANLSEEVAELSDSIYEIAGHEFNINSPMQLSEVLFDEMKLPTAGVKKTQRGWGTGQKELEKLRSHSLIIDKIEQFREFSKLQNTYVDVLPKLADSSSYIHTTFTQDVTSTGRLSSLSPNLQNIPVRTELGRKIREGFVAAEGKVFVSADYSQFELRLAAVLASDQKLIDDFNAGVDIHTKTASDVFNVPFDKVTKNQRRAAKVINFGVLYGMSPRGLSQAADMSFADAREFIEEYFALRQPISDYIDATLLKAKTDGYVETFFGRRRPTPDVISPNYIVREAARRAAQNMPIQGTEADLMKRAMIQLDTALGSLGEQVLQIHDSILVECDAEKASQVTKVLKDTMEGVAPELGINLSVDISTGKNWGEL